MQFIVRMTEAELVQMATNREQFKNGIEKLIDGGIELEGDGTVHLAKFDVVVEISDRRMP